MENQEERTGPTQQDLQGIVITMLMYKLGVNSVDLTREDFNNSVLGHGVVMEVHPETGIIRVIRAKAEEVIARREMAEQSNSTLN